MRPASPDGNPILGLAPGLDNVFLATGHGPSGLQLGPYSGALAADLALGNPSPSTCRPTRLAASTSAPVLPLPLPQRGLGGSSHLYGITSASPSTNVSMIPAARAICSGVV